MPLTIIVCMSWAVFWIDYRELGPTLALSSTAILTLIAFMFSLLGIQPPVSYLTHMDYFVYGSLSLVFFTHLSGLACYTLARSGREELATRLDYIWRFLIPLCFAVLIGWYLSGAD